MLSLVLGSKLGRFGDAAMALVGFGRARLHFPLHKLDEMGHNRLISLLFGKRKPSLVEMQRHESRPPPTRWCNEHHIPSQIATYIRRILSTKVQLCSPQVKRLSMAAVSTDTALTEARSKVDGLTRQLQCVQQRVEASEGLERDLKRLGQDAEEMNDKFNRLLEEKQVRRGSERALLSLKTPRRMTK